MAKLGATKRLKRVRDDREWLDFLWALWIKARAGFVSELSGSSGDLHAHHLVGKPNVKLRYYLPDNGICINSGEHRFGAHGSMDRQIAFQNAVKALRSPELFDTLHNYRNEITSKTEKANVEEFLLTNLAPYIGRIVEYYQGKNYSSPKIKSLYSKLFNKISEGSEVVREKLIVTPIEE